MCIVPHECNRYILSYSVFARSVPPMPFGLIPGQRFDGLLWIVFDLIYACGCAGEGGGGVLCVVSILMLTLNLSVYLYRADEAECQCSASASVPNHSSGECEECGAGKYNLDGQSCEDCPDNSYVAQGEGYDKRSCLVSLFIFLRICYAVWCVVAELSICVCIEHWVGVCMHVCLYVCVGVIKFIRSAVSVHRHAARCFICSCDNLVPGD